MLLYKKFFSFSLVSFKVSLVFLIFWSLNMICPGVGSFFLAFVLFFVLWVLRSVINFGEISYCFKYCFYSFPLSSYGTHIMCMLHLWRCPTVLWYSVSLLFNLFFFFPLCFSGLESCIDKPSSSEIISLVVSNWWLHPSKTVYVSIIGFLISSIYFLAFSIHYPYAPTCRLLIP